MATQRVITWFDIILITIGITHLSWKREKYRFSRYAWQLINVLFINYIVFSEALFTWLHRDDMVLVTVVFTTELTCFMDMVKMMFQMKHRDEIKDIIDDLIFNEYALKIPLVKHVMMTENLGPRGLALKELMKNSELRLMRTIEITLKVYAFCAYATITSMISLPILLEIVYPQEHYRELPFCMMFPWDVKKTPNYQLTYLININAGLFCVSAYVGLDTLFAFLIGHVIRQLHIIRHLLENSDRLVEEIGPEDKETNCINLLSSCAVHFDSIYHLCRRLNVINNVFFVVQAVCSSILICMCIFKIVFAENKLSLEVSQYYFYVMLATIQIGIYCCAGQLLINESQKLHQVLMSGWWSHSKRYRSNLLILQTSLQRPLTLHIWGSIQVSHLTFAAVVRTSVSYLALLKSVVEE